MTIYNVIDNHKAFPLPSEGMPLNWTILSGASILQGGNPFFIPGFANTFEARPTLAVRICKLGKNIAPRFAHRYVDAVAPCVNFTAADLLDSLRNSGMPWTAAVNFDRSAAFGKFIPVDFESIQGMSVLLRLCNEDGSADQCLWRPGDLRMGVRDVISTISKDNTIKTGDIILVGTAPKGPATSIGQHAEVFLGQQPSVNFNIR